MGQIAKASSSPTQAITSYLSFSLSSRSAGFHRLLAEVNKLSFVAFSWEYNQRLARLVS